MLYDFLVIFISNLTRIMPSKSEYTRTIYELIAVKLLFASLTKSYKSYYAIIPLFQGSP